MRSAIPLLLLLLFTGTVAQSQSPRHNPGEPVYQQLDTDKVVTRIALGSCSQAKNPLPIFDTIVDAKPDLMIFLGDNVYADTFKEDELRSAYDRLASVPGFRKLAITCPILATWDDHDYGINDCGAEHPTKTMAQRVFLDFWKVPADSPRREREGIYDSVLIGPAGKRIQIILLDTRYHRSPLLRHPEGRRPSGTGPYPPNPDPTVTMLGKAQWDWLKEQLEVPAELRLIASSIQVVPQEHQWEGWATMPVERDRLFDLIRNTHANGVIFLSGDRHHAELSRHEDAIDYPLYDITASSLNSGGQPRDEPNRHRVGNRHHKANYGLIEVDWDVASPTLTLKILGPKGETHIEHQVPLAELGAP